MPWIDQHGDQHPSTSDIVDWERDALHFICCPSCQRTMPWAWAIVRDIEAGQLSDQIKHRILASLCTGSAK